MRDSDWSRENLLRSDWLGPLVATMTTNNTIQNLCRWQHLLTIKYSDAGVLSMVEY